MDVYATEEQQVEAIKKWFNKYGGHISWTIIIVSLIASGVMYWRHHQEVVREQASEQYMALLDALDKKDNDTINSKADIILNQYAGSPYAQLAELVLAYEAVEKKEYDKSEKQLDWVVHQGKIDDFQIIAKLRLMRLLIAQDKLDEAMKLYDEKNADGFLTLMAELKGDILLKKKDIEGAKKAYLLAYSSAPEEGMHGPLLKMKMEELGIDIDMNAKEKEAATL
ncbi:MAG: tetratricopeptide repeat protein [Gammaproteobacteria bacterium]|jgi:predicted negative regulator of RcsB-dependent stress response|nr:tetratricopeptide repeat protein [Gammaproteobacteria bacterium]